MAGMFDDLIPAPPAASGGIFDDLIPPKPKETGLQYATGLAHSAAEGTTLGFADELAATAGSLFGIGPKLFGSKGYDEILADQRKEREDFEGRHPVASTAAQVAGGIIVPGGIARQGLKGGATLAKTAATGLGVGTGTGLVQGFGSGQGGLENRLENAANTAAIAGPVGAIVPVAGQAAAKAVTGTAKALSPYAAAAINQIEANPTRTGLDAMLGYFTGGMSTPLSIAARLPGVVRGGNAIKEAAKPKSAGEASELSKEGVAKLAAALRKLQNGSARSEKTRAAAIGTVTSAVEDIDEDAKAKLLQALTVY